MKQIKRIIILTMTGVMLFGGPALQTKAAEVEQQAVLSDDNSLSSLSLSEGELTPGLQAGRTKYTAVVPNEVTEVEVTAKPSNAKAQIVSVSGNTGLSEGENVISVVVKAENGAEATYKITLTRESIAIGANAENSIDVESREAESAEVQDAEVMPISETNTVDVTGDGVASDGSQETGSITPEEYDAVQQKYDELNAEYTKLKEHDRNVILGLTGACVVLAVICLILFLQKRKLLEDEDFFGEDYEDEGYDEEPYDDESSDENENYEDEAYEEEPSEDEDENYEEEIYDDESYDYDDDESYDDEEYPEDEEEDYDDTGDLDAEESDETDEEDDYEEDDYDETYDEEFEEEVEEIPWRKGRQSKRRHVKKEKTEDELEVIDLNDL